MTQYTLEILVEPAALAEIVAAGQKIVLAKQVTPSDIPLPWLSFSPHHANTIAWTDQYSAYASETQVAPGVPIVQIAIRDAVPKAAYGFQNNIFTEARPRDPNLGAGSYEIINESAQRFTFGLAQGATLNGTPVGPNPVFAATVLPGEWLDMTPSEHVLIFVSSEFFTSPFVGTVTGPSLTVTFHGDSTKQAIQFDYHLGGFRAK